MFIYANKWKHLLFSAVICFPALCFCVQDEPVVRAAIDIGSGATKLRVAEVDLQTKKINQVLINESFAVNYQEDLEKSPNGAFSEKVMREGIEALKKSQEIARQYHAENVAAVATASFRKATNAEEFIERIKNETGIKINIIDQKLEGILAFEATLAHTDFTPNHLVVWDIGGGSFQFTAADENGNLIVYRGVDASVPFKNFIIKNIKQQDPGRINTPNPLSKHEVRQSQAYARFIAEKVDEVFKDKILNPQAEIVGVGNIFAYNIYPLVNKRNPFTRWDLNKAVQKLIGKSDRELNGGPYVNVEVSNPIFVLGFMQTLGIDSMHIQDINNADGALFYPAFWGGEAAREIMPQYAKPLSVMYMEQMEKEREMEQSPAPAACQGR